MLKVPEALLQKGHARIHKAGNALFRAQDALAQSPVVFALFLPQAV